MRAVAAGSTIVIITHAVFAIIASRIVFARRYVPTSSRDKSDRFFASRRFVTIETRRRFSVRWDFRLVSTRRVHTHAHTPGRRVRRSSGRTIQQPCLRVTRSSWFSFETNRRASRISRFGNVRCPPTRKGTVKRIRLLAPRSRARSVRCESRLPTKNGTCPSADGRGNNRTTNTCTVGVCSYYSRNVK